MLISPESKAVRLLWLCAMLVPAWALAAPVSGRVEPGPCDQALVFESASGTRYEIEAAKFRGLLGMQVQVQGVLYPHTSICKQYPWLRIQQVAKAGGQPLLIDPSQPVKAAVAKAAARATATPVDVQLLTDAAHLGEALKRADLFQTRLGQRVRAGVTVNRASGGEFAKALLALSHESAPLLGRIAVEQGTGQATSGLLVESGPLSGYYASEEQFEAKLRAKTNP